MSKGDSDNCLPCDMLMGYDWGNMMKVTVLS